MVTIIDSSNALVILLECPIRVVAPSFQSILFFSLHLALDYFLFCFQNLFLDLRFFNLVDLCVCEKNSAKETFVASS